MTNLPPSNPQPSRRDWDELIAVVVALTAIGTILFWGLNRRQDIWDLDGLLGENVAPTATPVPPATPQITPTPAAVIPPLFPDLQPTPTPPLVSRVTTPGVVAPAPGVVPAPAVVPTATPLVTAPFPDVTPEFWAAPFIAALAQRGAVTADELGQFEPNRPVTREEYAIALERLVPMGAGRNPLGFKDVPASSPAIAAIDAAVQGGFLRGYPDGFFRPQQPIPRYQVFLSLANGLQQPVPANPAQVVARFPDNDQIPDYAVPAIAAAVQSGLVVNPPNSQGLEPNRPMTRAEMSAAVYQALVTLGQEQPINSPHIVRP